MASTSTLDSRSLTESAVSSPLGLRYWIPTGLLCAVFVVSILLTVFDQPGSEKEFVVLGFPAFFSLPLAAAKAAGVAAVLIRRYRTLTLFAFAGFLYDMILALGAHIHENDFPSGWIAVAGLVVWVAAFWADQNAFGSRGSRSVIKTS
jgi:hypothetical protein